jgi:hypothetical protein
MFITWLTRSNEIKHEWEEDPSSPLRNHPFIWSWFFISLYLFLHKSHFHCLKHLTSPPFPAWKTLATSSASCIASAASNEDAHASLKCTLGSLKTPLHPGWGTQRFLQHEDTMQILTDCLRSGFLKLLYFCWFKMGCLSGGWIKTILACSWCVPSFDTYQGCLDIFLAPFAVDIDLFSGHFNNLRHNSTQLDFEKRKLGLFLQRAKLQGQTQQSRDARKDGLAAPFLQRHSTPKIQTQKAATYWFRIGFVLKRLESKVTSRLRLSRIIAYYSVL